MNIVRKYKLSKLSGINYLSDRELDIINFVNSKLENLSEFTMSEYPNYVFYMNSACECIFEYSIKNKFLYIRNIDFWTVLSDKYGLDYIYVQTIMKYMTKTLYKINPERVFIRNVILSEQVESYYKMSVNR